MSIGVQKSGECNRDIRAIERLEALDAIRRDISNRPEFEMGQEAAKDFFDRSVAIMPLIRSYDEIVGDMYRQFFADEAGAPGNKIVPVCCSDHKVPAFRLAELILAPGVIVSDNARPQGAFKVQKELRQALKHAPKDGLIFPRFY